MPVSLSERGVANVPVSLTEMCPSVLKEEVWPLLLPVKGVWPLCLSVLVKEAWPLLLSVNVKEVWPLCISLT